MAGKIYSVNSLTHDPAEIKRTSVRLDLWTWLGIAWEGVVSVVGGLWTVVSTFRLFAAIRGRRLKHRPAAALRRAVVVVAVASAATVSVEPMHSNVHVELHAVGFSQDRSRAWLHSCTYTILHSG